MAGNQEPTLTKAASQQAAVVEIFDRFSGKAWDALYQEGRSLAENWKFIQRKLRVEDLLTGEKAGRLLDVGCGTGPMAPTLLQRGWEFHGLDIAPKMIEHARRRFAHEPCATFYVGKIEQAAFPTAHFDAVIAMGLLGDLNDTELAAAMKEMSRVLERAARYHDHQRYPAALAGFHHAAMPCAAHAHLQAVLPEKTRKNLRS